ncbi:hypothetical protein PI124_g17160 [Phytophthora idaei]|nr:hypothetical protein PI125_g16504 [Phytophthora idaei]KAG3142200.1 hypothetical protein PI126_g15151 [Phytophthora idaei]KAG3237865.1 hypothetical protein PI124_g17160 [Phytophthora idaei]
MGLDGCADTLLFLQAAAEMEYAVLFSVVGTRMYHTIDERLDKVAYMVSPHAFDLLKEEYDLISSGAVRYDIRKIEGPLF